MSNVWLCRQTPKGQAYITQPVAIRTGSLRRKNKSACAGAVRNSYEAYDERTVPAHRG